MDRHKGIGEGTVTLLILLLVQINLNNAGASSAPKNLVNTHTTSPNDTSNQFQNEYRQTVSKTTQSDRYRSSSPTITESAYEHLPGDLTNPTPVDYAFQDNHGTTNVPECKGRLELNGTRGFITDGPSFYHTNLQCIWVIDGGRQNATIRIQIHQFETECNYDHVYVFDGDSIYSPLVAALSGDLRDFSTRFARIRVNKSISLDNGPIISRNSDEALLERGRVVLPSSNSDTQPFEIKTSSGKAFIYFHSDTAQSMPGFYMTYTVDSCPLDCSNRGECDYATLTCKCSKNFFGEGCQFSECSTNCTSSEKEYCDNENPCLCNVGGNTECYRGIRPQEWLVLDQSEETIPARAFHQTVIAENQMWIIGGKSRVLSNANKGIYRRKTTPIVLKLDIRSKNFSDTGLEGVTNVDHLAELTGHSIAVKGNKIFIYGGMSMNNSILESLTVLDTKTLSLSSLSEKKRTRLGEDELEAPIAVAGHTANIVGSHMYVFLGYNPLYGYISLVQKFNLADNTWSLAEKKGSSIEGRIGHTTTYDPTSRLIYLYGGHNAHRSNSLYSFDPHSEVWTYLHSGPEPRYHHCALIENRQLIILGGNSYNTSNQNDQCYQQTYLTYDLTCGVSQSEFSDNQAESGSNIHVCGKKCWQSIHDPGASHLKRHGLSVVKNGKELISFGGFNGMLMNDIGVLNLGTCQEFKEQVECGKPKLGLNCHWNEVDAQCEDKTTDSANLTASSKFETSNCTKNEVRALQTFCATREGCTDCLSTNFGCVWCGFLGQCQYSKCKLTSSKATLDVDLCFKEELVRPSLLAMSMGPRSSILSTSQGFSGDVECKQYDNCFMCQSKPHCIWSNDMCTFSTPSLMSIPALGLLPQEDLLDNQTTVGSNATRLLHNQDSINRSLFAALTSTPYIPSSLQNCGVPCYLRRSCGECSSTKCIWCSTTDQCMDASAYFAYHAMGQCMHYVAHILKCPVASCNDIESCDKCLTNPKCGWLNDISNTGKGRCIEGTREGPYFGNTSIADSNATIVMPASLINTWFYTSCPSCQCNGHSYCRPNSSACVQSCQDNTEGAHCDRCLPGFFGDPTNGGTCRPCRCYGHAQTCNKETGKCYCATKGITGHNCVKCDDQYHQLGDLWTNGTCYYNLTTDYQYTFNMSKPEDHFYSDINFVNIPIRKDSDVDFTIACSRLALVNITAGTSYKNRKPVQTSLECGSFRLRFPHERHVLGDANYSFYVHVYKFQTPFILQIAFSQHRTLYLPQFFFTFSSCFLFFFALSGLVWKLKHEYDLYARRQRQFIEMEQMASRPFSSILLEIIKYPFSNPGKSGQSATKQPAEPTPISFEPCYGSNVGVLSFFVQLPGKPNLAIGSALVSLNEETAATSNDVDNLNSKRSDKDPTSTKNVWC